MLSFFGNQMSKPGVELAVQVVGGICKDAAQLTYRTMKVAVATKVLNDTVETLYDKCVSPSEEKTPRP